MSSRLSSGKNPADRAWTIVAALAASAIGVLMYNVLPLYLGAVEDTHSLQSVQTGLVGTSFFLGFNIAGATAYFWIRRVSWRAASLLGVPILIAMLLSGNFAISFALLLLLACVAGCASGVLYSIGTTIIGDTSAASRWYGVKVAIESTAGTLLLFLLPATLSVTYGPHGVVYGMVAFILLLTPVLFALPRVWQKDEAVATASLVETPSVLDRVAIFASVFSLLMVFAGISAIWAFAERMGKISGYDPASVGQLLAFTLFSGIFASLAVAWLGDALNTVRSYIAALAVVLFALVLLSVPGSFPIYAIGNCLYMMGWSAATPLASTEIARLDTDGRYTSLIVPAVGVGSMIGPAVAGTLLQYFGTSALFAFVAASILFAAVLMVFAARRAHLHRSSNLVGATL